QSLPIAACRGEILAHIDLHPVCCIIGATGSGKSTQLPHRFVNKNTLRTSRAKNYAKSTKLTSEQLCVLLVQPRRDGTRQVADQVRKQLLRKAKRAARRGDNGDGACGFSGGKSTHTQQCQLQYEQVENENIVHEKKILPYTHIILDEMHESSPEASAVLWALKQLMPRLVKSGIKVILMSATIEPN
ncbi:unnamed protein product, partial [Amoebophrya sp. A120]